MKARIPMLVVFAALIAGAVLASIGDRSPDVSLASVREIWADVLRDADQVGLKVTRVSIAEEMGIGVEMNSTMNLGATDPEAERYVSAVAARMLPYIRRKDIHYTFHVVESPEVNAFALPGGQIYVLRGLLDFMQSESELAAILGHEITHVDLRHCIERYQYGAALKKAGVGDLRVLADIAHGLVAIGYSQYQELEADAQGERLAIEAGYDPEAAIKVFHRMQRHFGEGEATAPATPAGEVTQSIGQMIGSYFRTHPASRDRERDLTALVANNRRRLAGRAFYVGVKNLHERVSRTEKEYPDETRKLQ
jgi:predicted Zn-dependent protease